MVQLFELLLATVIVPTRKHSPIAVVVLMRQLAGLDVCLAVFEDEDPEQTKPPFVALLDYQDYQSAIYILSIVFPQ